MEKLIGFLKDEEGASAVEYSILAAAIAAVIIVIVYAVGDKVKNAFVAVNTEMK